MTWLTSSKYEKSIEWMVLNGLPETFTKFVCGGFVAYVNLMDQYRPCYRADDYPELDRPITREEFEAALASAGRHGITRLDCRASGRFPS